MIQKFGHLCRILSAQFQKIGKKTPSLSGFSQVGQIGHAEGTDECTTDKGHILGGMGRLEAAQNADSEC